MFLYKNINMVKKKRNAINAKKIRKIKVLQTSIIQPLD